MRAVRRAFCCLVILFVCPWDGAVCRAGVQTREDVEANSALSREYVLRLNAFRKELLGAQDAVDATIGDDRRAEVRCQALVASSLLYALGELANSSDVIAWAYFTACLVSWKQQEDVIGFKSIAGPLFLLRDRTLKYVDDTAAAFLADRELRSLVAATRDKVSNLLAAWPYASVEAMGREGGSAARLRQEYGDLGRVSLETMGMLRAMATRFDPSGGQYPLHAGACEESLLVYGHAQGLAVRTISAMTTAQLYGLAQHHKQLQEIKKQEQYAVAMLNYLLPDFAQWAERSRVIGEASRDPAIRQAAAQYQEQYLAWRKALEAALATDGLTLPPPPGQAN